MKIEIDNIKEKKTIETRAAVFVDLNDEKESIDCHIYIECATLEEMLIIAAELKEASEKVIEIAAKQTAEKISEDEKE